MVTSIYVVTCEWYKIINLIIRAQSHMDVYRPKISNVNYSVFGIFLNLNPVSKQNVK